LGGSLASSWAGSTQWAGIEWKKVVLPFQLEENQLEIDELVSLGRGEVGANVEQPVDNRVVANHAAATQQQLAI
jgi:hypothetical protein